MFPIFIEGIAIRKSDGAIRANQCKEVVSVTFIHEFVNTEKQPIQKYSRFP